MDLYTLTIAQLHALSLSNLFALPISDVEEATEVDPTPDTNIFYYGPTFSAANFGRATERSQFRSNVDWTKAEILTGE